MSQTPTMTDDVNSFYTEADGDYIGLWQLVHRAKERSTDTEVYRTDVLDIARALLGRGLVAGNLTKDGGFMPWDEQQPDAVVSRIQQEWRELGHDPTIDDIAWFYLPR